MILKVIDAESSIVIFWGGQSVQCFPLALDTVGGSWWEMIRKQQTLRLNRPGDNGRDSSQRWSRL